MKTFLLAIVLVAVSAPVALAVDHAGQMAVGYYDFEAPLGIRYQWKSRAAFDLGVGATAARSGFISGTGLDDENFVTYRVEAGVPLVLVRSQPADLFVRPGLLWRSVPYIRVGGPDEPATDRTSEFEFKLHLGAEWHATNNLSFAVGHGVAIMTDKGVPPGGVNIGEPEGHTEWSSEGLSLTSIGFHWYFGSSD